MTEPAKSTPRPTPHQAELAAKLADRLGPNDTLRALGEEVLRTYFTNDYNRKPNQGYHPDEWSI